MKLTDITEGTFGNLISMAAAKIGSKPEDRLIVKADQKLFGLVQKAKTYQFHLFDNRALPWWKAVFDYFEIPQNLRMEVLAAARSEFYDRLDHSLFEADISKIADFLNPRTRQGTAKVAARAAVIERLAIAIIGYVSRAAGKISPAERQKAMTGKIKPPSAARTPTKPSERQKAMAGKIKSPPLPRAGPKVKKWKQMPDKKIIKKAMAVAKAALRDSSYLKQLDNMGFRLDRSVDPPQLRLKR